MLWYCSFLVCVRTALSVNTLSVTTQVTSRVLRVTAAERYTLFVSPDPSLQLSFHSSTPYHVPHPQDPFQISVHSSRTVRDRTPQPSMTRRGRYQQAPVSVEGPSSVTPLLPAHGTSELSADIIKVAGSVSERYNTFRAAYFQQSGKFTEFNPETVVRQLAPHFAIQLLKETDKGVR